MKAKGSNRNLNGTASGDKDKNNFREYQGYPVSEDIYKKYKEEKEIDPEDTSEIKFPFDIDENGISNELDFDDDISGSDLDVPGSELDDDQELIGNEDEENNYYSLGGDDHNDLDEDDD